MYTYTVNVDILLVGTVWNGVHIMAVTLEWTFAISCLSDIPSASCSLSSCPGGWQALMGGVVVPTQLGRVCVYNYVYFCIKLIRHILINLEKLYKIN